MSIQAISVRDQDFSSSKVSVDFIKAFDSVDREFLIKTLEKLGLQGHFLDTIKNLNTATGAKLIINGFISKTIKLRRGIKQGDALSLFLFLVALEPLILAIRAHPQIRGMQAPGNTERQKTINYADDVNAIIEDITSLTPLMDLIQNFGLASGLKIHPSGSPKCCSCLCTTPIPNFDLEDIPDNLRIIRNGIEILGTAIGDEQFIDNFTDKKIQELHTEAKRLKDITQNYHERSVIANSNILSLITYHAQFHGLNDTQKRKLDVIAKEFCLKNSASPIQYQNATHDTTHGGFGFPHLSKFTEATLLQQTFKYANFRMEEDPIDPNMGFFQPNIGRFISNLCDLRPYQNIRNTYPPFRFYQRLKNFISFYKVTKEEILNGSLKVVKDRIRNGNAQISQNRGNFVESPTIPKNEIHNTLQSNQTITFNYKMQNHLLPFPGIHENFGIQGATGTCSFCQLHRETETHLFSDCAKTKLVWETLGRATNQPFTDTEILKMRIPQNRTNRDARIYLTSTANRSIWKARNDIKFKRAPQFSAISILMHTYHKIKNELEFQNRRPREPFRTELRTVLGNLENILRGSGVTFDTGIT